MSEDALLSQQKVAPTYKNPFLWVPTSYFTMGLVYVTVGSVANIMFMNLGMPNHQAALWSSLLGFPYTLKFLWAPLLELYRTKKFFVVLMQFILAAAGRRGRPRRCSFPDSRIVAPALILMALAAVAGATQDIGSDGVYVTTLRSKEQANYTGFQSMCWNLGRSSHRSARASVRHVPRQDRQLGDGLDDHHADQRRDHLRDGAVPRAHAADVEAPRRPPASARARRPPTSAPR